MVVTRILPTKELAYPKMGYRSRCALERMVAPLTVLPPMARPPRNRLPSHFGDKKVDHPIVSDRLLLGLSDKVSALPLKQLAQQGIYNAGKNNEWGPLHTVEPLALSAMG